MKRSELDKLILENRTFIENRGFVLPPFAYWNAEQWRNLPEEYAEIRDCQLGWDVTDFGSGDFHRIGLFLMTLRNGLPGRYPKPYAEKIMVVEENQVTPMHFHWKKMEDIINRGGGNLMVQVYNSVNEALYFGVPLLMLPQTAEQKGVARRVEQLGAGVMLKGHSAKDIHQSVIQLLCNEEYYDNAANISKGFRRCSGAKGAAQIILDVCNS